MINTVFSFPFFTGYVSSPEFLIVFSGCTAAPVFSDDIVRYDSQDKINQLKSSESETFGIYILFPVTTPFKQNVQTDHT
jgi:hypothetical protein